MPNRHEKKFAIQVCFSLIFIKIAKRVIFFLKILNSNNEEVRKKETWELWLDRVGGFELEMARLELLGGANTRDTNNRDNEKKRVRTIKDACITK